MLSDEIIIEFKVLLSRCNTHLAAIKKRIQVGYYRSSDEVELRNTIRLFEKYVQKLNEDKKQINELLLKISRYKSNLPSPQKAFTKKPNRNQKKESDFIKEPNENLINNKNVLSGGAWEMNRRKH